MANPTQVLLQTYTVPSGGVSTMTFSSIPSSYNDLKIVCSIKANESAYYSVVSMRFNGDTGANYAARALYENAGTTPGSSGSSAANQIGLLYGAGTNTANDFGNGEIYIPNYTSNVAKTTFAEMTGEANTTGSNMGINTGYWSGTAAITSITLAELTSPFLQNSSFYLYGITNS